MITSTEVHKAQTKQTYPYLGVVEISGVGRRVVLFIGPNTGICIFIDGGIEGPIGEYREDWLEAERFTPYEGTIELKNGRAK